MNNVQFEDNSKGSKRKNTNESGSMVSFLQKQGISKKMARRLLLIAAIVAFAVSVYFWLQVA